MKKTNKYFEKNDLKWVGLKSTLKNPNLCLEKFNSVTQKTEFGPSLRKRTNLHLWGYNF